MQVSDHLITMNLHSSYILKEQQPVHLVVLEVRETCIFSIHYYCHW